jgi:hypothetical protein
MDCQARPAVAKVSRAAFRGAALPGLLLLALASGCIGTDPFVVPGLTDKPTAPSVTQVVAVWKNQAINGIDPAHNGAPMHGLAGRVFLFGSDWRNATADGRLVIELYGIVPGQAQEPVRLETWEIKKDILNGVCRRTDGMGLGYSLSLPWPGYRPDITQVQLWVRYEPEKGGLPVSAINGVTLNSAPEATPVYTNRVETGNRQVIPAAPSGPPQQAGAAPPQTAVVPPQTAVVPPQTVAVPPQNVVQPAAAVQPPPAAQPPGGVQQAGGFPPPSPPQGTTYYQPACTVQPAGGTAPPQQAPFQPPNLPTGGSYQQPQYQMPQQQGVLPR